MPIVTLTTDWGTTDFYAGALKGELLSLSENITIVDISHHVESFDLLNGAFIFRNAYTKFPNGTVHVIGLVTQAEEDAGLIAIRHNAQYFIGMNDGFFSLVFDDVPADIISISPSKEKHTAFDQAAVAKAATFLAAGRNFADLGKKTENFIEKTHLVPVIEDNVIKGTVIYIDEFQNVITNITRALFERVGKGKNFELFIRKGDYNINVLSKRYNEVVRGSVLALFNTAGYLEIAINQGNAAGLLGMTYGDIVRIDFK